MNNQCGLHRLAVFVLVPVLLLGCAPTAAAQGEPRKYELFGGYAFLQDLGDESTSLPLGWNASIARNFGHSFGVALDLGGNYKSEGGVDVGEHAFLGGARFSFRGHRVTPYVESLAGMVRTSASSAALSASTWDFAVQAGTGLGFRITDSASLRAGVDFRNIFQEGDSFQQFRVVAGLSFGLGSSGEPRPPTAPRPPAPPPQSGTKAGAPTYELFGGYAFLQDLNDESTSLPLGWDASIARNLGHSFGVALDLGGHYKSEGGVDVSEHAFLGGARFSFRGHRVTPYVEALAGMVRTSASSAAVSASTWDFAVQAGTGLGLRITDSASLRAGVDFRNIFQEGDSFQQLRVVAGLSFGFGGQREVPAPTGPDRPVPISPRLEPSTPRDAPVPRVPAREPEPGTRLQAPTPRPSAGAPLPESPSLARGRELLRSGNYAAASAAFREQLRLQAPDRVTIAAGLYCDSTNLVRIVRDSGSAEQIFLLRARRRGRSCYGVYWGLFASRLDAQQALGSVPPSLHAVEPTPIELSRLPR